MCCLFGLIDTRHTLSGKDKSKIIHILASESEARGTDATGIAYNLRNRLYIHKRPIPGHKLKIWVSDDTATVMGHTRMTTQGRASRNRNNHPFFGIAGDTPFALAHNGVLYNDTWLRSTQSLPKTRIETDSYVAVQLLEQRKTLDLDSLRFMAEQVEGSFTFTVVDDTENLFFVKGDSPICLYWFPRSGVYLYDSTEEILGRALQRISLPLGSHTRIPIDCGEILRITPRGRIARETFNNPYLYWSRSWPYAWMAAGHYHDGQNNAKAELRTCLDEIKSVAAVFGYTSEEIDQLAEAGLTPEELEEVIYNGVRNKEI